MIQNPLFCPLCWPRCSVCRRTPSPPRIRFNPSKPLPRSKSRHRRSRHLSNRRRLARRSRRGSVQPADSIPTTRQHQRHRHRRQRRRSSRRFGGALENLDTRVQRTSTTDGAGTFKFDIVEPGRISLTITSTGFAPWISTDLALQPGQIYEAPQIALQVASAMTEIAVTFTQHDIAEEQMTFAEKQRVLGVFPNFYASYVWDAAPLSSGQKFRLAWRTLIDPVTIAIPAIIAAGEQSEDAFSGYGQGAQGYAKRFGASYTDTVVGTMIVERNSPLRPSPGPALLLQRQRKHSFSRALRHLHRLHLQGRQRPLAAQLLQRPRQPRLRGNLQRLLPLYRPKRHSPDHRQLARRHGIRRSRLPLPGVPRQEDLPRNPAPIRLLKQPQNPQIPPIRLTFPRKVNHCLHRPTLRYLIVHTRHTNSNNQIKRSRTCRQSTSL